MSPLDPDEFMDADTLARWLGVEKLTVVRMARLGKLPGRKVGKEWRFSRSAILESFRSVEASDEADEADDAGEPGAGDRQGRTLRSVATDEAD